MKLYEIINSLLKIRKIDQIDVARAVGIDQSQFSKQVKGKISFTIKQIEKLEKYFGIDLIVKDINLKKDRPSLAIQDVKRYQTFHESFAFDNYIPIPLLDDSVSAGSPSEINDHDIEGWCLIYSDKRWIPHPENTTCVRVQGKSMYPILDDGDIIAVDHSQHDPRDLDGQMVVFRKNGGVTVKWLKCSQDNNIVMGIPQNVTEKLDTAITLREDEIEYGIVGKVVWWWAKR